MKPDEIQHLLGGYATGTLTPEEQKALFDAALQDQNLFEALAREQALKETLDAAGVRRELLEALESATSWREQVRAWLRWQIPLAATGVLAAAALTVIAISRYGHPLGHSRIIAKSQIAVAKIPAVQSVGEGPAEARLERQPEKEKLLIREELHQKPSQSPTAKSRKLPPTAAAPAPPVQTPGAVAESALAQMKKESEPMQTALLAGAEQGGSPGTSSQARDLFYGATSPAARSASGIPGGVVGGYPSSAMATPRAKAILPPSVRSDQAAPAAQAFGLRYSGRNLQGAPPQLVVESNTDAVLYIFRRGESGDWLPVTPGGMSLKARTPATTPSIGVDANAPSPRTLLVLSRTPLAELAQTGADLTAALDILRASSNMAESVTQTGSGSNYVVLPRSQPGATLVVPVSVP